jgi:hypothetical protein
MIDYDVKTAYARFDFWRAYLHWNPRQITRNIIICKILPRSTTSLCPRKVVSGCPLLLILRAQFQPWPCHIG